MNDISTSREPRKAMPRIGDAAPDFLAVSTHGELRLSAWIESRWIILFGFPAAFTPVAVSEFKQLSACREPLEELGTKVLAFSPDTIQAQIAWQRDLHQKFGISFDFPLVSDFRLEISELYGMLHPSASARAPVRGVFILDPKRTVRFMAYYPLANGRSIKEIMRVLSALQSSDNLQAPTPADWKPGDAVLQAPPSNSLEIDFSQEFGKGEDFYSQLAPKQLLED